MDLAAPFFMTSIVLAAGLVSCTNPPMNCHLVQTASVPITFIGGQPTIPVTISGQPVTMILDTGAGTSLLNKATTTRLRVATGFTDETLYGVGGIAVAGISYAGDLTIDGIKVEAEPFTIVQHLLGFRQEDHRIGGILGNDILRYYNLALDFPHHRLKMYVRNTCPVAFPFTGYFSPEPLQVAEGLQPQTHILVDQHPFSVILDTGAGTTLLFQDSLSRGDIQGQPVHSPLKIDGIGASYQLATPERFDSLTIGAEEIDNPIVAVTSGVHGATVDGIIGENYLRTHQVYVSVDTQTIYFGTYMPMQTATP